MFLPAVFLLSFDEGGWLIQSIGRIAKPSPILTFQDWGFFPFSSPFRATEFAFEFPHEP